jgi:hypothetical protein
MKIVKLQTFQNPIEANIVKCRLESEGIECFLTNENISRLLPNFSFMFDAGIQLMINENDYEKASEILELNKIQNREVTCPHCFSENVKFGLGKHKLKKIFAIFISLLTFTPFNNIGYIYYCKDCKTEFK